jgi:effector-binding domain-containing protein
VYQIVPRTLTEQQTLVMRGKVCAEHIGSWLAEAYRAVGDHAQRHGVRFTGPPFASYRPLDSELLEFEVEAGFPVSAPTAGGAEVEASILPGGRAATTWHTGPYESLACAHEALERWMIENGSSIDGPCWEVYYSDPMSEPDPVRWRTEIVKLYR